MFSAPNDRDVGDQPDATAKAPPYPTNQVVAILDTEEQVIGAVEELTSSGFLDSEVQVGTGVAAAGRLSASTGRSGLTGLVIRIAERLGVADVEMEIKHRYEQALRDGHFVVLVPAPTEERKQLAAGILERHGAHTVAFHGRFSIEGMVPPKPS